MIEWFKQNIFTVEGRLNRLRYFKYTLLVSVVCGVLEVVLVWLASKLTGSGEGILITVVYTLSSIPMFIGNAMVTVRRCHDLNMSGGFVLLCIIPIVNVLFGIYLLFAKGTVGWNKYGADPLMYDD
ncbi:MAG: DUF805 domain-containing protein [Selenomonadaceae bacterium]|nr:DUF805 domain-containing protein [Selenomonadaceae bacterium]